MEGAARSFTAKRLKIIHGFKKPDASCESCSCLRVGSAACGHFDSTSIADTFQTNMELQKGPGQVSSLFSQMALDVAACMAVFQNRGLGASGCSGSVRIRSVEGRT